jgi:hypothetical protein
MVNARTNRCSNPILSLPTATVVLAASALGYFQCDVRPWKTGRGQEVGSASTQPFAPEPDEPIACKTDSDCPSLACGPCTPGEVIKKEREARECYVNPCLDAHAVCGPKRVCVVNAEARKNPLVFCPACFNLEFDKVKLCAKSKAEAECQRTVDETARACDQDKCAKARLDFEAQDPVKKRLEEMQRQKREEDLKRYKETQRWFDEAAKH